MSSYTLLGSKLLFPLHELMKGHDTVAILREIEVSQWWSPERLLETQTLKLMEFVTSVRSKVPYFHDRIDPAWPFTSQTPQELLQHLPITDKAMIRTNAGAWRAGDVRNLSTHSTSGSSGEPLQFLLSKYRVSFDIAAKWRATRWWGVDIGDREMVLWGSPIETATQDRIRNVRDRLLRSRLVAARDLDTARIDRILDEIRHFRPRMLFGYPSALARIALRARDRSLDMSETGIRVAFCTSEVLRPEWRALISGTFGCGVANEYGARDAGFIARECPHGGLHLTAEEIIVEIVDDQGRAVRPGEEGDILVTNLAGPEFPFIRYRTGDRGRLSSRTCPCGRGLPLLEELVGRSNDGLISTGGCWIHGSAINHLMRDIPGLLSYRVTQNTTASLDIQLVLEAPLREADGIRLRVHARHLLGTEADIVVRQVNDIPNLANGKFRHIVCNVKPEAEGEAA